MNDVLTRVTGAELRAAHRRAVRAKARLAVSDIIAPARHGRAYWGGVFHANDNPPSLPKRMILACARAAEQTLGMFGVLRFALLLVGRSRER